MKQFKFYLTIIIFSIAFVSPLLLRAQDTRQLSLQEAIDLGIENSKQLKASDARIDQADAALQQAKDNRLPNASA
ncbi:MAG: TolC family protein, partial [Bacteroidota bacterium]|nr:TolC family protein [Bacteroidota bacterium]